MGVTKDQQAQVPAVKSVNSYPKDLSKMPAETLCMIFDELLVDWPYDYIPTLAQLSRTCRKFYWLAMPRLHKGVSVAAEDEWSARDLIRTLCRYMSIEQLRELKHPRMHAYEALGLVTIPRSVHAKHYVRHLRIGTITSDMPADGPVLYPYLEEAFKCLNMLEIVDTTTLTKSMAHSMTLMRNLRALRLQRNAITEENKEELSKLGNIKHISIHSLGQVFLPSNEPTYESTCSPLIRDILQGMAPTLQILEISGKLCLFDFVVDWQHTTAFTSHKTGLLRLDSLKYFTLRSISINEAFLSSLHMAIDFTALCKLALGPIYAGEDFFFESLIRLFAKKDNTIRLRILRLTICSGRKAEVISESFGPEDAICRLICSLDTLKVLEVRMTDNILDPFAARTNLVELPDGLLQAILHQKGLESLELFHTSADTPWLSASAVAKIIGAMPLLQNFHFVGGSDWIEITQALAKGTSLRSITCSYTSKSQADDAKLLHGSQPVQQLLMSFLCVNVDTKHQDKGFLWENHYALRRLCIQATAWEVASSFATTNGVQKMKTGNINDKGEQRAVCYRKPFTASCAVDWAAFYQPDPTWIESAERGYAEDDWVTDPTFRVPD